MEAWLARGDLPSDAEARRFLENPAVDALLDLAGAAGRALLRRLTLFDLPAPEGVAQRLEPVIGCLLRRLRDLGLVDAVADLVDPRRTALAANALAAGRLEPLTDDERKALAGQIATDLFGAWGGKEKADRPPICDLELARLGLLADDGEIVSACAAQAVMALQGRAADAAKLGQAAVGLLDAQGHAAPWRLLSETAQAAATGGDGATADRLLERGVAALEDQRKTGAALDPVAAGFLVYEQGQRLVTRGELDEAGRLFEEAEQFARERGDEVSATIARGKIADILYLRGELDEALRIRREDELPVYERLGEARSRAVAMGQIADILARKGDLAASRALQEERLEVNSVLPTPTGSREPCGIWRSSISLRRKSTTPSLASSRPTASSCGWAGPRASR